MIIGYWYWWTRLIVDRVDLLPTENQSLFRFFGGCLDLCWPKLHASRWHGSLVWTYVCCHMLRWFQSRYHMRSLVWGWNTVGGAHVQFFSRNHSAPTWWAGDDWHLQAFSTELDKFVHGSIRHCRTKCISSCWKVQNQLHGMGSTEAMYMKAKLDRVNTLSRKTQLNSMFVWKNVLCNWFPPCP